jgi:hypothetical protein
MSSTLAQHIPLSLFDRWAIDAEILKEQVKPIDIPKPKPKPKPTQSEETEDDGFIVVNKGYKKRTPNTSQTDIKVSQAFSALPSGKPTIPNTLGTGKSHKKNMTRKTKKTQTS